MARRDQTKEPFHRVMMVRTHLDMAIQHGVEPVLEVGGYEDVTALLTEAHYALGVLTEFRNIINGMVDLKQDPKEAVKPYLEG